MTEKEYSNVSEYYEECKVELKLSDDCINDSSRSCVIQVF